MFDLEFWKNFLSNALATFVGAIIGIPIALWINRIQQKSVETAEKRTLDVEAKKREVKVLQLIKDEMIWNKDLLIELHESRRDILFFERRNYEKSVQLKTELWNAFSNGGELQWIHDINILHVTAQTYDSLQAVIRAENTYTIFVLNASVQYHHLENWSQHIQLHEKRLFNRMHENINSALENTENALKMIDQKILINNS